MDAALCSSRAPALRPLLRRQPAARRLRALASDDEALWTLPVAAASPEASAEQRAAAKARLVLLGAVTSRGQAADFTARVDVEDAVLQLESLSTDGSLEALTGRWSLVYASVELYRSSPFFWTFAAASQALLGSEETALNIFRFTSSLPVAGARGPFAAVSLCFDLPESGGGGRFSSEVAMSVFDPFLGLIPGPSGVVVTEGRLVGEGSLLRCTVESTRVDGALSIPAVPVESLFAALRGGEALSATARVGFVDQSMLVIRTGEREDAILVYARQ